MDALDVLANPVVPRTYLGVYHVNLGNERFALRLASSRRPAGWCKIADLDADGGGMGTLRALSDGGFLLAYEAQRDAAQRQDRHERQAAPLPRRGGAAGGRATAERTLPRRLSSTNEGTPNFRGVAWHGSLASSRISLDFHYLDHGPKLAVDREAHGTLDDGDVVGHARGGRRPGAVEAGLSRQPRRPAAVQLPEGRQDVARLRGAGVRERHRLVARVLYDVAARRLKQLRVATPRASRSFANPCVSVLPSPAGGNALVVSMFVFGAGAGSGESGELVYYQDL